MLETSRNIIDEYITKRDNANFIDPERKKIIDEYFRNKKGQEIAEYLISVTASETGGLTALSGFYYQFLVTIEYIIEMLEDKWDFVIMEYHDDVVVGKGNKIRFIQVKTSQKIKLEVTASPASGLYNRTKKKIKDKYYIQANSWVDKLLSNAALAKKSEGYETEFQLYSSYHFIRTQNYNFDHYTDNKFFNKKLPQNDDLLKVLSQQVFDDKGQEYSYLSECEENIEELLERFYLHTGLSLQEIDKFQDHLCMKLNRIIFKGYGENITIGVSDLNFMIGYLFEECTDKSNIERLIITKEKIQNLLDIIRSRAFANASLTINQHDSLTVINRVIDELITSVQGFKNSEKISKLIYEYRDYLKLWITRENGDIKKLLVRLFDGTDKTSIYSRLSMTNKENSLLELFTLTVMLIASKNKKMVFEKNESLIIKKSEDLEMLHAFLRLEVAKKKSEAIEKLKTIVKNTSLEEQLYLMEKDLNVIIQNYNDRQFKRIETVEIDVKEQIDIEGLEDFKKLNEVPIIAKVLPGKYLLEDFYAALDEESIEEYLAEILEELKGDIS
ncbi:dsDNA nuclease domain-containing protein [Ureibacillus thermosphaericus]|uniref:dsDNA nuclease domain-containing protein n=1 Tax=Ureibacillus thermosphaericus TaxID=51173 RepID=UPI00031B9488|nr:dsDNA nuclease domain-containing protein [Ureibacillus thermosphaericus]